MKSWKSFVHPDHETLLSNLRGFLKEKSKADLAYARTLWKLATRHLVVPKSLKESALVSSFKDWYAVLVQQLDASSQELLNLCDLLKPDVHRKLAQSVTAEHQRCFDFSERVIDTLQHLNTLECSFFQTCIHATNSVCLRIEEWTMPLKTRSTTEFPISRSPSAVRSQPGPSEVASAMVFKRVVDHCWAGSPLVPSDIAAFKECIESREARKLWGRVLNSKRTAGQYYIHPDTIGQLAQLLKMLFTQMLQEGDFVHLQKTLILSQTYCTVDSAGRKVFLQEYIKDHQLWTHWQMWEAVILEAANEEFAQYISSCVEPRDTLEEDLPTQLKNMFTSKLFAFVNIMNTFDLPRAQVIQLVHKFRDQYGLCEAVLSDLSCCEQ